MRRRVHDGTQVPTAYGKADLTIYRDAGAEVVAVLADGCGTLERASIDEARPLSPPRQLASSVCACCTIQMRRCCTVILTGTQPSTDT